LNGFEGEKPGAGTSRRRTASSSLDKNRGSRRVEKVGSTQQRKGQGGKKPKKGAEKTSNGTKASGRSSPRLTLRSEKVGTEKKFRKPGRGGKRGNVTNCSRIKGQVSPSGERRDGIPHLPQVKSVEGSANSTQKREPARKGRRPWNANARRSPAIQLAPGNVGAKVGAIIL